MLDLRFQSLGGKTTLVSSRHVGPLTVQRPFYPEEGSCHLYLLHPPGGIVGGDELSISAIIEPNCHTLITMPGASKFYLSNGKQARLQQTLTLGDNAMLEWLPQDTIFFPGAQAALHTAFHLTASSTLLAWDLLCLGRPVIGEAFSHGTLTNRMEVWVNGSPMLIERLNLEDGELACVAQLPLVGTMLFYPANEMLLDGVREKLMPLTNYAGASLTDALLTVRFLSDDNLRCQRVMRDIWQFMRPHLIGKSPILPRIWLT
ncbi:TPA: urease accessory protein UreD [Escherichia coli]|nr:urease accessory protein UreD [Escherichia coli]HDJ8896022.1 urease accessory protein UreD [Escherichia coli]HDJ8905195.1 urease accessory protein UreD [Escherichia coli]HDJ8909532.1 urease accessory protein UreD [Escherichia coli]HDK1132666.1 urease accessory protein UreD [Escherichia coli]